MQQQAFAWRTLLEGPLEATNLEESTCCGSSASYQTLGPYEISFIFSQIPLFLFQITFFYGLFKMDLMVNFVLIKKHLIY